MLVASGYIPGFGSINTTASARNNRCRSFQSILTVSGSSYEEIDAFRFKILDRASDGLVSSLPGWVSSQDCYPPIIFLGA